MKKVSKPFILGFFVVLILSFAAFGQKGGTREKRIKFAAGKTSATIKGLITDRQETHLYFVRARAGQTVTVVFNAARKDVGVCVLAPANRDFCGRRKYSLKASADGDFEILVDGRRENIGYNLTVSVK